MSKKTSFDSDDSNGFSDCDVETKEHTQENDDGESEGEKIENLDLIKSIAKSIESILEENKLLPNYKEIVRKQRNSVFSSDAVPNISLEEYLLRIQKYANMEKNTLIVGVIYIDRLAKYARLTLTYHNIHRIFFTAIMLSIKYNEDLFYDNKYYSQIAGVKVKELKMLEYNFANLVGFCFFVKNEIFEKYENLLDNSDQ